jgi:hypothetical protein
LLSNTISHKPFLSGPENKLKRDRLTWTTLLSDALNTYFDLIIQDMVLLHHEVEVEYSDERPTEKHQATLLEFGKTENGRSTTAMALTVGVPAAIGALVPHSNHITHIYHPLN